MKSTLSLLLFSILGFSLQAQPFGDFDFKAETDGEYIVVKIKPNQAVVPANSILTNFLFTLYWPSSYQIDLELSSLITPIPNFANSGPKGVYGSNDLRTFCITSTAIVGPWIGYTEIMRIKTALNSPSQLLGTISVFSYFPNAPIYAGPPGFIDPSPFIEFSAVNQYIMDITGAAENVPLFRCNADAVKTSRGFSNCPSNNGGFVGLLTTAPVGTYSWTSSTNSSSGTGQVINNLSQGFYNITTTLTNNCKQTKSLVMVSPCGLRLAAKVFLDNVNPTTKLMSSNLAMLSSFPTADPYSAAPFNTAFTHVNNTALKNTLSSIINTGDNNTIVDWIIVELRQGTQNATTVAYTRSALLQKDGDVVDMDGVSPLTFKDALDGNYYIVIRHRNHLGFRTLNAYSMSNSSSPLVMNFTNNSIPIFGNNQFSLKTSGASTIYTMNGGDFNFDGAIDAFDHINWYSENSLSPDYSHNSDFNADGVVNGFDLLYWEINNGRFEEIN